MSNTNLVLSAAPMLPHWNWCKANAEPDKEEAYLCGVILEDPKWIEERTEKLEKFYQFLEHGHRTMLYETAVGRGHKKVHKFGFTWPKDFDNGEKCKGDHALSATLIELAIMWGRFKVEYRKVGYGKRSKTYCYLKFENTEKVAKSLISGYTIEPGALKQKAVGHNRLNKYLKDVSEAMDNMRFKLSDTFDLEEWEYIVRGSPEFNGHDETGEYKGESVAQRELRFFTDYYEGLEQLSRLPEFRLPMYYLASGRKQYWATQLYGARPGGRTFEYQNIDLAVPRHINARGAMHIKHVIYAERYGKCSLWHANKYFKEEDHEWALAQSVYDHKQPSCEYVAKGHDNSTHDVFSKFVKNCGEAKMMRKMGLALQMYYDDVPCPYMVSKDQTNSGLMNMGASFRSSLMMKGANLMGHKRVNDSHTQFGIAHAIHEILTRDQMKDIHTPLLHGASDFGISRELRKVVPNPEKYTEAYVRACNIKAYGPEVRNIDVIAEWGMRIVSNDQNIFKWKLPDGFVATHTSVIEGVPFHVYVPTGRYVTDARDDEWHDVHLVGTMPMVLDPWGSPMWNQDNKTERSKGAKAKYRGLFANLTHSIESYGMRRVIMRVAPTGASFLLRHDNYIMHPNDLDMVIEELQEVFSFLQEHNLYQSGLDQIAEKLRRPTKAPRLRMGNAPNKAKESYNFLMP